VAAGIVHIWTTLRAMEGRQSPGYTQLIADRPVNAPTYLKPITPSFQPLPFMMPDSFYAVCPYDTAKTAVRLKADLLDAGWSLSLHTPDGANFYFVPGTALRITRLDLTLQPAGTAFLAPPGLDHASNVQRPKILLAHPRGVAIVRAPIEGLAYRRTIDESLNGFGCAPLPQAVVNK